MSSSGGLNCFEPWITTFVSNERSSSQMQAKDSPLSLKTMLHSYRNGEEHLQVTAKISRDICLNAQDGVKCLIFQSRKHLLQFNTSWGKEQKLHFYPSKCYLIKNFKHVDNVLWPYIFTSNSPIWSPLRHFFVPSSQLHVFSLIIHSALPYASGCRAAHPIMVNLQGPHTWRNLTPPPRDPMPTASQLRLGPWVPSPSRLECWLAWSCEAGLMQATITLTSLRVSELFPSTAPWPLDLTVFEPFPSLMFHEPWEGLKKTVKLQ